MVNMKLILSIFEQLSGLKINFHKSELYWFGKAKEMQNEYREIFGCEVGSLPLKYLGIPIHYRKLLIKEWKMIEDRFEKKLGCWASKMLSYGDRLVLINSVLSSLPMFLLSFFQIPMGVRKRLDYFRSRFFWQSEQHKRKYRLTKWNIICRPKDQGRLGIEDLQIKNKCLLSKWIFKILNEKGVWHELLCNKYLNGKTLAQTEPKPHDSPFWKGIMAVKNDFFERGTFVVGNGLQTRFWEDAWLGNKPLAVQYPSLYNIVQHKNVLVGKVLANNPLNIVFRRPIIGDKMVSWLKLVERLMRVSLSDTEDRFKWNLTNNGVFTVKSLYQDYMNGHTPFLRKYLWKLIVLSKSKFSCGF